VIWQQQIVDVDVAVNATMEEVDATLSG